MRRLLFVLLFTVHSVLLYGQSVGDITKVDSLEFESGYFLSNNICTVGENGHVLNVFAGGGNYGILTSVEVNITTGVIPATATDTIQYYSGATAGPGMAQVGTTDWYCINSYLNSDMYTTTVTVGSAGDITEETDQDITSDYTTNQHDVVHIDGGYMATSFVESADKWVATYSINTSTGSITNARIDSLELDTGQTNNFTKIMKVGNSNYFVVIASSSAAGGIQASTVEISDVGIIGSEIEELVIVPASVDNVPFGCCQISDTLFVVACAKGGDLYYATFSVSTSDGDIKAQLDTYASGETCAGVDLAALNDTTVVAVWTGTDQDGYIEARSINVHDIRHIALDSLEFNDNHCFQPKITHIGSTGNVFVAGYEEAGDDGWNTSFTVHGYTAITYSDLGWAHKIMGVTPGKVDGVSYTDINKVMGLEK